MPTTEIWTYTLMSVILVSLISFIGIFTLSIKARRIDRILIYLVSFSVGALFGDAFIHLLPEAVEKAGFTLQISLYTLLGIATFFVIEKFLHWHHHHISHREKEKKFPKTFVVMNLFGDGVHNFIDGLIIGASYLASIPLGIATTLAVVFHEIPQEIGDFGVLLHGGFSRFKALYFNFLSAITAIIGAIVALILSNYIEGFETFLLPFAAGGFIYIAGSDLIPELHKETTIGKSLLQLLAFTLGVLVMLALVLFE